MSSAPRPNGVPHTAEERLRYLLDIAERRSAELTAVIESMPDAVYLGTLSGITACNSRALTMLGARSLEDLQAHIGEPGTKFAVRWPDTGRLLREDELQFTRALKGETVTEEVMATNPLSGEIIYIRSACAPIVQNGQVVGAVAVNSDITDRKRVEEERERLLAEFNATVSCMTDGVVVFRPDATLAFMNPAAGRIIGCSPEAAPRTLAEWVRALAPAGEDGRPVRVADALTWRALRGETLAPTVLLFHAIDGRDVWVSLNAAPMRTPKGERIGAVTVFSDITERKRAEEATRRSATLLAHAGRLANLGAWDIDLTNVDDLNANQLHWSDQVYRIFGYEPGEVEVTNELFFERVHPEDRPRVAEAVAQALAEHRPYSIEHRIVCPNGTERTVFEYADIAFDAQGRPCRMTGAVQDITDRKHHEEELRELNAQLADADRRKDEFIAMLSHELRNPLAPIRYALPMIEREPHSDSGRHALAVIQRQVDHLTRLVDDLLDVSRITRGRIELRREHVTLASIVGAAVEAASPAITGARHALETNVADEPIWLDADPARIAQVVTNLLNNSAKYTPRGGRISLEARRDDGHALIRVRDTGTGIPPESLGSIFEMFRQGQRPDAGQGGLGIGLALVKLLVEMHGGSVEARSAGVGQGAEFEVRLPLAEVPRLDDRTTPTAATTVHGRRLKVLIVDDNVDLVEMLAMDVARLGHDVRKAFDGRSAISAATSYRPDVVLLDLGLPVMGGLEVGRELRARPETAEVRLVALTGWGQAEDRARTRQAGFDDHLTKPTEPGTLERLLNEVAQAVR
jgi:PAS domain S-box-containing protein